MGRGGGAPLHHGELSKRLSTAARVPGQRVPGEVFHLAAPAPAAHDRCRVVGGSPEKVASAVHGPGLVASETEDLVVAPTSSGEEESTRAGEDSEACPSLAQQCVQPSLKTHAIQREAAACQGEGANQRLQSFTFNVRVSSAWLLWSLSPFHIILLPFPSNTAPPHTGASHLNDGALPRADLLLLHHLPHGPPHLASLSRDLQYSCTLIGQHPISEL